MSTLRNNLNQLSRILLSSHLM